MISRGNGGADVFLGEPDYRLYLETLAEACERAELRIHAFVLMRNHYHLLMETPNGNLIDGMRWLQQTFTQRYNARHNRFGHVYQGRYKAQIIDVERSEDYFRKVGNYIHLNPARAGLIAGNRRYRMLADFPWSSFPLYGLPKRKRPEWLVVSRLLGEHDWRDDVRGRREYAEFLEECVLTERREEGRERPEYQAIRRGWFLGGEEFREKLIEMAGEVIKGKRRTSFEPTPVREVSQDAAKRLIARCLKELKLPESDLPGLKKTDERKMLIAWILTKQTTVGNEWISAQLVMGHYTNASNAVRVIGLARHRRLLAQRKRLESVL